MNRKILSVLPLLFLAGCASQKYTWSGYDDSLYAYYKHPTDKEKFIERLQNAVLKAEQTGKVPPGLYAEYGYMLYEQKGYSDAIIYFKKEHDLWPESQMLMAKMIKNTETLMAKQENKEVAP